MQTYAANLLKLVLDKSQSGAFTAIRFISGMNPAYVNGSGPHFLKEAYLSSGLVTEIHQLCLSIADEKLTDSDLHSSYSFELRRLGRVLCKYECRENVARLVLERAPGEANAVKSTRTKKPPQSGVHA